MKENQQENHLDIELNNEVAQGVYSNLAIITHSKGEFVSDFVQMMPGMPKALVRSRVIMNASNAKKFLRALSENIAKYEQNFGLIEEDDFGSQNFDFGLPPTKA